jgi:hypothetical protein
MFGKGLFSNSRNILILILFGLILLIFPINCDYDYCKDWRMKGFYMNDTYFEQYGGSRFYPYYYINFLKKHYYFYPYEAWRDSYGNIIDKIDFKRDFHMGFRNRPYPHGGSDNGYNFGVAIVFGPHKANKYRLENTGPDFLVQGLDKSLVIIFRNFDQQILVLNCLDKPCDIKNPAFPYFYNKLGQDKYLFVHIIYSAAEHSITLYKNDYNYENNKLFTYDQAYLTDYLERGW